ncbi:hypothetical protein SBD_3993 [Streptomyces bottropensis ATCC 25435]|uniref:Uncharacterized protein n=1 Tax=Streptomyces bottropensis ATCC 25435 TaxID=1054862 RepID=M3FQC0_9ACTN|nr:hypothetical protein SBD_3993 [Streptomyces bottropensis ATCC 25435]
MAVGGVRPGRLRLRPRPRGLGHRSSICRAEPRPRPRRRRPTGSDPLGRVRAVVWVPDVFPRGHDEAGAHPAGGHGSPGRVSSGQGPR